MGMSRQEKEIIAQMEREEHMQAFTDQINELKTKREEYARIAAEAEINGDDGSYQAAISALIQLNEVISGLVQAKTNFDIINVSNAINVNLGNALNALTAMSGNKANTPDLRKLQKANVKISSYMRKLKISQKAMSATLKTANPANKARSQAEIDSVKPMIDAARAKMTNTAMPKSNSVDLDISAEIEREKNRII